MTAAPADLGPYLAEPNAVEPVLRQLFDRRSRLVIFDVGACEGEDSIRYARLFPQARIFAFEALPQNQALIRENLARYGVKTVELVPIALSDRSGEAAFHISSGQPPAPFAGKHWNYGNKSSSLLPPAGAEPLFGWIEFKETITVKCSSLDDFCSQRGLDRVDFVHLDVQGAESLVLDGAVRLLPTIRALWLEVATRRLYRGQKLRAEIEQGMRQRGWVLVLDEGNGAEGDQLYVNPREFRPRLWLAWWRLRLAQLRWQGSVADALRRAGLFRPRNYLRP
jgi:FkbM family methyltransferase